MKALSGLYGAVVGARNSLFETGLLATRRLRRPVISIGNLSVGGSGKTPFVIMLGELLAQRNCKVDVLSRGYGRRTKGVLTVAADGSPELYGDEPLLIARKLRCPVIVGEDRYAAGRKAESSGSATQNAALHLLDDGFQHRRLHRDFDVVLLNCEDLDDKLLPAGRLREPLNSLRRVDAVAVDPDFPVERLPNFGFQVWRVQRTVDTRTLAPGSPFIAFCAIARPQRFFAQLLEQGLDLREQIALPDHHRYSRRDVERLASKRDQVSGSILVTTEKDEINLSAHFATLNAVVVPMRMTLLDANGAIEYMFQTIARRRAGISPDAPCQ